MHNHHQVNSKKRMRPIDDAMISNHHDSHHQDVSPYRDVIAVKKSKSMEIDNDQCYLNQKLRGCVFVVAGVFKSKSKDEWLQIIVQQGGIISSTLGRKVTHALLGEHVGDTKWTQIRERQLIVMTEQQLIALIEPLHLQSHEMINQTKESIQAINHHTHPITQDSIDEKNILDSFESHEPLLTLLKPDVVINNTHDTLTSIGHDVAEHTEIMDIPCQNTGGNYTFIDTLKHVNTIAAQDVNRKNITVDTMDVHVNAPQPPLTSLLHTTPTPTNFYTPTTLFNEVKNSIMDVPILNDVILNHPINLPTPSSPKTTSNCPLVSTLWTDKYKPTCSADLVGNTNQIKKMIQWLYQWDDQYKQSILTTSSKTPYTFPRALLLVGSPGIGKTCAALMVAQECHYSPIHLNASDQRSKLTLKQNVSTLLSNRGMGEYFNTSMLKHTGTTNTLSISSTSMIGKTILIMDEIDGMSSGDRGGLAELNMMIKTTKIPIIALANDRYKVKTLASSSMVLCLKFDKPTLLEIYGRITSIVKLEPSLTTIPEINLKKILQSCQGDLRMTLNCLQMIANHPGSLASTTSNDDVNHTLQQASKDATLGAFEVAPRLLAPTWNNQSILSSSSHAPNSTHAFSSSHTTSLGHAFLSLDDRLDYYFVDYSFVPLFIQHNYIQTCLNQSRFDHQKYDCFHPPQLHHQQQNHSYHQTQLADLKSLSQAAQSMALGDMMAQSIYSHQHWNLLPFHGVLSTLLPAALMNRNACRIDFPSTILAKGAKARKRNGLMADLQCEMHVSTGGLNRTTLMDYIPHLHRQLHLPLMIQGREGIQPVLKFMSTYGISKESREFVSELQSQFNIHPTNHTLISIPPVIKTAFTRAYHSMHHKVSTKRNSHHHYQSASNDMIDLNMENDTMEDDQSSMINDNNDDDDDNHDLEDALIKRIPSIKTNSSKSTSTTLPKKTRKPSLKTNVKNK